MGSSSGRMIAAVVLLCLLSAAHRRQVAATITCGQVGAAISRCADYVRGVVPLTSACCDAFRSITAAAKTTADRRAGCNCMKIFAERIQGLKPSLALGVPDKCHVHVHFPISASTDCTKVH